MDYKKLIDRLAVHGQSLAAYSDESLSHILEDAATAIQTLLAERDAVVEKIHGECNECIYSEIDAEKYPCNSCHYVSFIESPDADHWQWRGIQEGCKSENDN